MGARLIGGWLACLAAGAIAACGLDENGTQAGDASLDVTTTDGNPSTDAGPQDVQVIDVVQDVVLPPTCATTDVSCFGLGSTLPDGWSPYVYVPDGGACPSVAFAPQGFVTNTQLTGGCTCSCTAQGSWSCPSTLQVTGGNGGNCNPGGVTIEAGVCQDVHAFNLNMIEQIGSATAAGSGLACDAGTPSAPVVTWNDVTMCAAGCDAGTSAVCSAPTGTRRCIAADGVQTCPGSLTAILIGGSADPACNDDCACQTETAPACTAVAHLYWDTNVGNDGTCSQGDKQDITLSSACQAATHNYDGYIVTWNDAGPVTCTPNGGGGDAGLTTPKTVCCTN